MLCVTFAEYRELLFAFNQIDSLKLSTVFSYLRYVSVSPVYLFLQLKAPHQGPMASNTVIQMDYATWRQQSQVAKCC